MAITIDYSDDVTPQFVIQIPRADMLLVQTVPTEIRQLNIDSFRRSLDDLMDDMIGMAFETTHVHTPPLTVAGVTLARVVEILAPYVIEFEDGQYNVNIVGGNSNISDRTIKNQVGVNTANSAGLQDPFALQAAAFGGSVAWDPAASSSGTTFPYGTRNYPVNNVDDLLAICAARGLRKILVLNDAVLDSGDFSNGYNFEGDNITIVLTLQSVPDVANCEFRNMTVQGDLDGGNTLRECSIIDLNYFNGFVFQCGLTGTLSLLGSTPAVIMQSFSLVADEGTPATYPKIDLGGTQNTPLVIRDWTGALSIINCSSQLATASFDISSGRIHFDSTITDGSFDVRGIAEVTSSAGAGVAVSDLTIGTSIPESVWDYQTADHRIPGSFGGEVALASDARDSAATDRSSPTSGSVIYGTVTSGDYTNIVDRDGVFWTIQEDAVDGLAVEFEFTLPSADHEPGAVSLFGYYDGSAALGHYIGLWAYNVESGVYDLLDAQFMPGDETASVEYSQVFREQHIDRIGGGLVRFRLIHNVTTYNASHHLYMDRIRISTIDHAGDFADAVWDGVLSEYTDPGTFGGELATKADTQTTVLVTLAAAAGCTTTEVRTNATQPDGFYDGMLLVVVNTVGSVARTITSYANTNGAFTLTDALPFTPAASDIVMVLAIDHIPISDIAAKTALIPALV